MEEIKEKIKEIIDYPPKGHARRTKDGYPSEVVYDEFAYKRMVDFYRDELKVVLKKIAKIIQNQSGIKHFKKVKKCPPAKEARESLFLSIPQFCELLGISEADYIEIEAGKKELSKSNKLFLVAALNIAKEKGIIP